MAAEGSQLWAKDLPLHQAIHRFTVGEDPIDDLNLLPWDAVGSAAHARTLAWSGHLPVAEAQVLIEALHALHAEALAGRIEIKPEQEDGHTALEAALVERTGESGKRIHMGRSRNDQVILAQRLYTRDTLAGIGQQVAAIATAFLGLAERYRDVAMPGYTHMRRGMPSSWGLWGAAFAEGLAEELEALHGLLDRLDRCPSGAAAGFGAPLPFDRSFMARQLGFARVQRSPIDVMNSRGRHEGAVADWLASVAGVLERAFWDLALFTMEELGFAALPDAFTTGSSIMPQKRNPDVVELSRGTCRKLRGQAALVHEIAGGLPSSYHRDIQLLKGAFISTLKTASGMFAVLPALLDGITVNAGKCAAACSDELWAAHEATALAMEGMPFRDAYKVVGKQVLSGEFHPDRTKYGVSSSPDLESPRRDLQTLSEALEKRLGAWNSATEALWTAPIAVSPSIPSPELP
nr:lyase family protein [uncultured Holophaga sp.]